MGGISEIADFNRFRMRGFNLTLIGLQDFHFPIFFNQAERSDPIFFNIFIRQVITSPIVDFHLDWIFPRPLIISFQPINFRLFIETIGNKPNDIFTVINVLLKCLAIYSSRRTRKALSYAQGEIHGLLREQIVPPPRRADRDYGVYFLLPLPFEVPPVDQPQLGLRFAVSGPRLGLSKAPGEHRPWPGGS